MKYAYVCFTNWVWILFSFCVRQFDLLDMTSQIQTWHWSEQSSLAIADFIWYSAGEYAVLIDAALYGTEQDLHYIGNL